MTLISCDFCGCVINTKPLILRYKYDVNYRWLPEHFESHKDEILFYFADLEQTKYSYEKYCMICKKLTYFSEVQNDGN